MSYNKTFIGAAAVAESGYYPIDRLDNDVHLGAIGNYREQWRAESITVHDYSGRIRDVLKTKPDRQNEFNALVRQWKRDTGKLSMAQKKAMHPSYQRIIGMGQEALPLILSELRKRRDDWLWALTAITGKNDVVKSGSTFDEAVDGWLKWGMEHSYLIT